MADLTFSRLIDAVAGDAVAGDAVALRSVMRPQPVDGPGGKVFPPTYSAAAEHKYAIEERQVGESLVTTVLLDGASTSALLRSPRRRSRHRYLRTSRDRLSMRTPGPQLMNAYTAHTERR